ncbi:hypothetical protein ACFL96_07480 [Thermoproteota archaeon]
MEKVYPHDRTRLNMLSAFALFLFFSNVLRGLRVTYPARQFDIIMLMLSFLLLLIPSIIGFVYANTPAKTKERKKMYLHRKEMARHTPKKYNIFDFVRYLRRNRKL